MKKIFNISTVIFIILFLMPVIVRADVDGAPPDPDAPIDGGLSVLIAAGVGYGVKHLKQRYRKGKPGAEEDK